MLLRQRAGQILAWVRSDIYPVGAALVLVAGVTAFLLAAVTLGDLARVTIFYLVPILIAATRWGTVPALAASIAGIASLTFFFYPPHFTFYIADPDDVATLAVFVGVALLTSHLAGSLKRQATEIARREQATSELYALSRKLAAAHSQSEIYAAVQSHLASAVCRQVLLLPGRSDAEDPGAASPGEIPDLLRGAVAAMRAAKRDSAEELVSDPATGTIWLLRSISPTKARLGVIAVDLGSMPGPEIDRIKRQIGASLTDVEATLDKLDIGRALHEAELRAETDRLREALIGSVSHDLRSPLTAILCSASVLGGVPSIASDERLAGLVEAIRAEAERHNNDIQNLLDASRINSRGVQPEYQWCDPTDIVNAAVDRFHLRYAGRHLNLRLQENLPLLFIDSLLVEQALLQVMDNAAKYSSADSVIEIATDATKDAVRLVVRDQGAGLTQAEKLGMWSQFYRGSRHVATTTGSGLGLWVANAFVTANGGRIEADSEGEGHGTTLTMSFPVAVSAADRLKQVDRALDE